MSLELLTPVNDVFRRDLEMNDPTLLDPTEADAIVQGEWLRRDTTTGKLVRATAGTQKNIMQVWTQKGDFSAQAIGKCSVIQQHPYEAETDMFDPGGTFAIDTELAVETMTIDGVSRAGLAVAAAGEAVIAICTKPPQANGGKLRYQVKPGIYLKA